MSLLEQHTRCLREVLGKLVQSVEFTNIVQVLLHASFQHFCTCRMRWHSFSSMRVSGTTELKEMPPVFFFLK